MQSATIHPQSRVLNGNPPYIRNKPSVKLMHKTMIALIYSCTTHKLGAVGVTNSNKRTVDNINSTRVRFRNCPLCQLCPLCYSYESSIATKVGDSYIQVTDAQHKSNADNLSCWRKASSIRLLPNVIANNVLSVDFSSNFAQFTNSLIPRTYRNLRKSQNNYTHNYEINFITI